MAVAALFGCANGTDSVSGPPSEVQNVDVLPGDGSLQIAWEDPPEPDLDRIEIDSVPAGDSRIVVLAGVGIAVIGNLQNDTSYEFLIRAVDADGNSSEGVSVSGTPGVADTEDTTPPADVANLVVTAGDGQATFSWVSPTDPDCDAILITHDGSGGDAEVQVPRSRTSIVYGGLQNGSAYEFTFRTEDLAGNRSDGTSISVTPVPAAGGSPPGAVADLTASAGDSQAVLTWNDPADTDLNYLEFTEADHGIHFTVSAGKGSMTVGGLTNGESYTFTVVAVDTAGLRSGSVEVTFELALYGDDTPPQPVTNLQATPGDAVATLTWNDPDDDDLSHLLVRDAATDEEIMVQPGNGALVIGALSNGTSYTYEVVAVDVSGNASSPRQVSFTPESSADVTDPGPVTSLTATAGVREVTLSWSEPSTDVSVIRIENLNTGGVIFLHAGREGITIGDLTADTEYTFEVTVLDAAGNSSTPETASATPVSQSDLTPPDPVTDLGGTPGDAEATLSWTDPSGTGNEDLDHIEITSPQFPAGAVTVVAAGEEQVVLAGLTNDTTYTFTVFAVDEVGNASSEVSVDVTPFGTLDTTPPGPVSSLTAGPGDTFVTLNWTDPADTDDDLSYVRITNDQNDDLIYVPHTIESAVIGGLTNGITYTFTARAGDTSNNLSVARSDSATPISGDDSTAPANVTSLNAAPGDSQVTLSWSDPGDTDLNHIEVTHDQTGGDVAVVVAAGLESVTMFGLTNSTAYEFTVDAVDEAGNHAGGVTASATPAATTGDIEITISPPTASDEPINFTGGLATIYTGVSPLSMTVAADLTGATGWEWYLNGYSIDTGSSSVTVSTSYPSPNPPYPLIPGVHSLVVVAEKNGQLYSAEVEFSVANNN